MRPLLPLLLTLAALPGQVLHASPSMPRYVGDAARRRYASRFRNVRKRAKVAKAARRSARRARRAGRN